MSVGFRQKQRKKVLDEYPMENKHKKLFVNPN